MTVASCICQPEPTPPVVTHVPEPSALALFLLAVLLFAAWRRA